MQPVTFWQLVDSLKNSTEITLPVPSRIYPAGELVGVVGAIEAEDGSGKTWNIRFLSPLHVKAIDLFVRTID